MTFKTSGMFHCINCFLPSGKQKCDRVGKNLLKISWCPKSAVYDIFHICLVIKSIPTERPNFVQPTLNKIDVEALKRDLKKFEEHYPVGISRAWTQWLQDVDKRLDLPTDWEWPLDILKRSSKVQRPANEDVTIPDKETVETQQVWLFVYGKWCLVHVYELSKHRFSR